MLLPLGVGAGAFQGGVGAVLRAADGQRDAQDVEAGLLELRTAGCLSYRGEVVVLVGVLGGVGDQVGVVAMPAAGHRDVQMLAVQPGTDQDEGPPSATEPISRRRTPTGNLLRGGIA